MAISQRELQIKPDLTAARQFTEALTVDGKVTFQTFDDSEEKRGGLSRIFHGRLDKHFRDLSRFNGHGAGVFLMVNPGDGKGRSETNVTGIRAVFVDLDGSPLDPILACEHQPHCITETSPGKYHAFWRVQGFPWTDDLSVNKAHFSALQKALCEKFRGDPNITGDMCRVMRVPGFWHRKREPFQVRIHTIRPDLPPYDCREFARALGLDKQRIVDPRPSTMVAPPEERIPQGQRHQSMLSVAARLRNAGLSGERLRDALMEENRLRCDPSLPDAEIDKIAGWAGKKDPAPLPRSTSQGATAALSPLTIISFADLTQMNIPEPRWIVNGLIPEGLTILGGHPKIGKSWLVQHLSLAVATGGLALGNFRCEQGSVLHLALEDTPRRFQKRMTIMLKGDTAPRDAYFVNTCPAFSDNERQPSGLDHIQKWLEDHHRDCRLIVIDTLQKIRPRGQSRENLYMREYRELEPLQSLAGRYGIAIICVTHLNQGEHADPLSGFQGSAAIPGTADTSIRLDRAERAEVDATLFITGRDVESQRGALRFDRAAGLWHWLGDASELAQTKERAEIIHVMKTEGRPMRPAEIADALPHKSGKSVHHLLTRMVESGVVERAAGQRGRYILTPDAGSDRAYKQPSYLDSI